MDGGLFNFNNFILSWLLLFCVDNCLSFWLFKREGKLESEKDNCDILVMWSIWTKKFSFENISYFARSSLSSPPSTGTSISSFTSPTIALRPPEELSIWPKESSVLNSWIKVDYLPNLIKVVNNAGQNMAESLIESIFHLQEVKIKTPWPDKVFSTNLMSHVHFFCCFLVVIVIVVLLFHLLLLLVIVHLLRPCDLKSNAHAHVCAFALDGVKNVTDERTNKAFLGVGYHKMRFLKASLSKP